MSEYAGFIQPPVWMARSRPFKNSNNYIDIGCVLASFTDPDGRRNDRWQPRTINLSVAEGRYNMLD